MAPPRAQEQRVRTFAQRILFRHLSKQQAEGLLERLSFGRRLGQHRTRRKHQQEPPSSRWDGYRVCSEPDASRLEDAPCPGAPSPNSRSCPATSRDDAATERAA